MRSLQGRTIVVAGGTGNVGTFIVRELLERGATVAVPSRSGQKLERWRASLPDIIGEPHPGRLHTFVGGLTDETGSEALREQIMLELGGIDAVLASLGRWYSVPSLLSGRVEDMERALQGFFLVHYTAARTFIPALMERGGTYVFINGPLAFDVWGAETALASVSTAALHMFFRALSGELQESPVQVTELVSHAYIRNREMQPGSPVTGEAVGVFAAHLLSGAAGDIHGRTIHLRSLAQLEEAGLAVGSA